VWLQRDKEPGMYKVSGERGWEDMPEHWYPDEMKKRAGYLLIKERFTLRMGLVSSARRCFGIWDWKLGEWVVRPAKAMSEDKVRLILKGIFLGARQRNKREYSRKGKKNVK